MLIYKKDDYVKW